MKVRITKYIFPLIILFISVTTVAQNFGVDGYLYKMQEDNTVAVTGHNDKTITEIDVPKMVIYNNIYFPITKIEAGAFSYFSKVTNVILSDNITEIGNTAFSYCYNMENLKLPSKLVKIGNSGFSNCGSLTGIKLPQTLEEIGTAAFQHCYKLTELDRKSVV